MNFVKFMDNRFQTLAVDSAKQPYSTWRDGESLAITAILWVYRRFFGALFIPKVFLDYALVQFRVRSVPRPELDLLKAQYQAGQHSKKSKAARKVGFEVPTPPERLQ